ncbi:D-alanyl-D-alanine carboxypeptidase family protein [Jiella pelagia]|uniref:D-alanyl-D-alanine carboxypeptidase n=1 Tax=Jiella pelagia TaxID=2986949 RepID=A0ABY7C0H2_9HYPH|nr:D-alanyl-D-alanine carboxypeptidase family protein [Jiella pelagia]WAP68263.1 D-alanyl-D-alanine carboxypeptidase [Jiella pelagia]
MVSSTLLQRLFGGAVLALLVAGIPDPQPAAARQAAAAVAVPTPKPSTEETDETKPAADAAPSAATSESERSTEVAPGDENESEAAPSVAPAEVDPDAEAADTPDPVVEAEPTAEPMASIVVDVATGKVLSQQNATERRYPASTTKLMTAYLALKALRDGDVQLDSPVIVTRLAAAQAPSKMGYSAGSVIRLDNALKMMLVKSANDIAVAIGQSLAGESEEDFVAMMNAEAARLGMKDTRFINPNGLPGEGQRSSAKDLAILAVQIRREFPAFSGYFDVEAITNGKSLMKNGNKLLGRFEGADGMKTGYICASGFNLVSSATRDGRTLVAVVLGANGTIERERLAAAILQAGFETDPADKDMTVEALPASSGEPLDVSDYICSQVGRTARANERVEENDREEMFGSPYLTEMKRPPVTVKVGLGGASGNDLVEPGVSIIANYGIPIPTPRPTPPAIESVENAEGLDSAATLEVSPSAEGTAPAQDAATEAMPAKAPPSTVPTSDSPADEPSAVNSYSGGQSNLRFPLGVRSPMAKRGPRLDSASRFDLRPAAYGQRKAAPEHATN